MATKKDAEDSDLFPDHPQISSEGAVTTSPDVSPQDRKKIEDLDKKISNVRKQIEESTVLHAELKKKLETDDPEALVQDHIRRLHRYNEIRDIGQGLMGMIAERKGVRVVDVYDEFGVGEGD